MSSSRSTRSVTTLSTARGPARWTAPPRGAPGGPLERPGQVVVRREGQHVEVDRDAGRARSGEQRERHVGGAAVRDRGGTGVGHRREDPLQRGGGRGRVVDRAVPGEAGRGRHPAAEHGRQRRLVDLHDDPAPGDPAPHVGDVAAQPLGERLRELAAGAVVGEHPVAAGPLDGGRQRPRTGDLDLERPGVALGLLLDGVEVLGQQGPRPPVVEAGRVGQPPAGGLEVGAEVGDTASARPVMSRVRAAARELGHVRQVGQLVEHDPDRLGRSRSSVPPGMRPDAGGGVMPGHAGHERSRR